MGCCQTSLSESEFHSSPSGSLLINEKTGGKKLAIALTVINESSAPIPKQTPCFGKKFQFEEGSKSHESRNLDIN